MKGKLTRQDTESYYVINHLVMFTGLTDRIIRSYIGSGILQGEKINGLWHFTPKQVDDFVRHPAVRSSILAKNNSLVYDFLLEDKKKKQEMCIILDIPYEDKKSVAEFFCYNITNGDYRDIQFAFDVVMEATRVILKGDATEVLRLMNEYNAREIASN